MILHRIDIATINGIMKLTGTVDNILSRDRAQELAQSIKGVRKVINEIDVKPVIIDDEEIKKNIEHALLIDPVTELYEVESDVDNGIVTLTGKVDSWAERRLCAVVVKSVIGVEKVNNDLSVETGTVRDDKDIELEIKKALDRDARIESAFIDVAVEDGTVVIIGFVGSALDKMRVDQISRVVGVKSVDLNDLKVEWWARNKMKKNRTYSVVNTDADIQDAIYLAFLNDPRISQPLKFK